MYISTLSGIGAFGALLHIAGSVLIVYGQTIVKVAHCIEESSVAGSSWFLQNTAAPPKWRRPDGKWRPQKTGSKSYATVGWSLFAIGNIMRFVSMRFAAQTVLSGLGSLQFVVIPLASRTLLGIKPLKSTFFGVFTVLVGNLFIILYGPPEVTFSLAQLRHQWTSQAMKAFLIILVLLLGGLHLLWRHLHKLRRKAEAAALQRRESLKELQLLNSSSNIVANGGGGLSPTAAGALVNGSISISNSGHINSSSSEISNNNNISGLDGIIQPIRPPPLSISIPTASSPSKPQAPPLGSFQIGDPEAVNMFVAALLFSAVASFIGAWSVLFSKSLTYVVSALPESLLDWYSWFTVIAFLGSAAYWVRQSNKGLKLYPATLIMPLMQAFGMCMSVLEGMIYFDEMAMLEPQHLWLLCIGLLMALAGAVAMGLAGYFNEQPQLLALAMSPTSSAQHSADVESQRLLVGPTLSYHNHKNSGLPPSDEGIIGPGGGLVEIAPRLGTLGGSVVHREKSSTISTSKEVGGVELVGGGTVRRGMTSGGVGLTSSPNSGYTSDT